MKHKDKEMTGRIILGIIILVFLAIIIVPKPQKNNNVTPPISQAPQKKAAVLHLVTLTSKGFNPQKITIKKGEVVVWSNKSGHEASVNSANHPTHKLFPVLNLGEFGDGLTLQARIYKIGALTYHNHLIPTQTGTVIVTE